MALLLLLVLAVVDYAAVAQRTNATEHTAELINTTGRQRARVLRIALLSTLLVDPDRTAQRSLLRADLRSQIHQMRISHALLRQGLLEDGRLVLLSAQAHARYFEDDDALDPHLTAYLTTAETLVNLPDGDLAADHPSYQSIMQSQTPILDDLSQIADLHEAEAEALVDLAQAMELGMLVIRSAVLVGVGVFIFAPLGRRVQHDETALRAEIEERKRAEAALRDSEERFRQLVEHIDDVFWLFDKAEQRVIYASPAFERVYGVAREAFYRDEALVRSKIHPDDTGKMAYIRQTTPDIGEHNYQYRLLREDGEERLLHSRAFPIRAEDGSIIRVAGVTKDITEQKRAEQQALELAFERERTRILSSFIRDAAHEFRTPLSTILTSLELLGRTLNDERANERVGVIRSEAERILKLVEALSKLTKIDGDIALEHTPISVDDVLNMLLRRFARHARAGELTLSTDLQPTSLIHADPYWLEQALTELLDNAYRFTPAGGRITLTTFDRDDHVVIRVSDTGAGIADEHLPHIFERFYRADAPHTTPGLGLGLSIAARIIDLHAGTLTVETEPGQGSRFEVLLPIASESLSADSH